MITDVAGHVSRQIDTFHVLSVDSLVASMPGLAGALGLVAAAVLTASPQGTPASTGDPPRTQDRGERAVTAVREGNLGELTALLDAGLDVNAVEDGEDREPLLVLAARMGNGAIVSKLMEAHAITDATNTFGNSALMIAALTNRLEIVKYLIGKGAAVDLASRSSQTALMHAAARGHGEVVRALLDARAHTDPQDKDGYTALMFAAHSGHREVVELLLASGADPHPLSKGSYGGGRKTALQLAAEGGHERILELLRKNCLHVLASEHDIKRIKELLNEKADRIDSVDGSGRTPLHVAAAYDDAAIVTLLLGRGADATVRSEQGETPMDLALKANAARVVRALSSKGITVAPPGFDRSGFSVETIGYAFQGSLKHIDHIRVSYWQKSGDGFERTSYLRPDFSGTRRETALFSAD